MQTKYWGNLTKGKFKIVDARTGEVFTAWEAVYQHEEKLKQQT